MTFWNTRRGGNDASRRAPSSAGRGAVGRTLAALVTVALLGGLWLFFAPTRLGGKTEYVVTYGVSMQPRFHAGDLAIVRSRSHYEIGQIVAYKNRELGRVVLHRIVGRSGDRYVFKGDNNNFVDSYHPTRSELIGRLWVRIPRAGTALLWLAAPPHEAFVGGLAFLATLLLGGSASRRRGRRAGGRVRRRSPVTAGWAPALLGTALVTALAFGLLAGVSYSRSTTRTISAPGYAHEGAYSYAAHVSPSALYPSGRLATGQTVFTRLVRRVEIGFSDRLVSALPHSFHGSAQLRLALQSSLGWTVPLPSPSRRPVSGDSVRLTQTLDLRAVEAEISRYLTRTGIATDTFTLTVTPRVDVHGTVSGQPVTSTFEPTPLTFLVDGYALRLAQSVSGAAIPGQAPADPLQPSAAGTVDRVVERTVALPGRVLPVATARRVALDGLAGAGALAVLALAAALAASRSRDDETARIRRRRRDLLVAVAAPPAGDAVDVESLGDLVRIADYHETVVLTASDGGLDRYYVVAEGIVYRFGAASGLADESEPQPGAADEAIERPERVQALGAGFRDDYAGLKAAS